MYKEWDKRRADFKHSRYQLAAAVVAGLQCGDMVNDPVTLDLVATHCLSHITLYGRDSTWTTTCGNAEFVPVRVARLMNGMFAPVASCPQSVMPAKAGPCCTVTSIDATCDMTKVVVEESAKECVAEILESLISTVVEQCETDKMKECFVSLSHVVVPDKCEVCYTLSSNKGEHETGDASNTSHACATVMSDEGERASDRVLRSASKQPVSKNMSAVTTVMSNEGEHASDRVLRSASKQSVSDTSQVIDVRDVRTGSVVRAEGECASVGSSGTLLMDLVAAVQEAFPAEVESGECGHGSDEDDIPLSQVKQMLTQKRASSPVQVDEDDIPLSQVKQMLTQKRASSPVQVDEDDIPLSQVKQMLQKGAQKRAQHRCDHDARKQKKMRSIPSTSDGVASDTSKRRKVTMVCPVVKLKYFVHRSFLCSECSGHFQFQRTFKAHVHKVHK